MALFHDFGVSRRDRLCGVPQCASAQFRQFLSCLIFSPFVLRIFLIRRYQKIIRPSQQDRHSVSMPFLRIRQYSGCNQGDFEPYNTILGLKSI